MSRSFGGRSLTTCSSIFTVPDVIVSRPAITRSAVVLPQPDGPTNTTNSPSPTARSRPVTASVPSGYTFVRFSSVISANAPPGTSLPSAANLLASSRSDGGRGCDAVETRHTSLATCVREPSRPRAPPHRPGNHLHGARRGRSVRLGDLPQLHGRHRRLAVRQLGRFRQLHERLAGREFSARSP